ncbi:MAG: patatin-like phospholipase family protein, partial [Leucothrix sp.]
MRPLVVVVFVALLAGCTTFGVIENRPIKQPDTKNGYSITKFLSGASTDTSVMLAFSGGGTRAAAVSYGVLKALRDTPIKSQGKAIRLLDEVGNISAVSGGSFTAAYYGIHGERTFDRFEQVFLRRNIEGGLKKTLLNPRNWFDERGHTELAVDLYQQQVFKGATFADMLRPGAPLIMINASDLARGVRFSFVQEYFNLLCSDLRSFPVARAVAASSAVPVVFDPVVIKNHADCKAEIPAWLKDAMARSQNQSELQLTISGLDSYSDKVGRKYAHFVDGGITDNLGLRAIYDVMELGGGARRTADLLKLKPVKRFVIISVNAATKPQNLIDQTNQHPTLFDAANAMSDVQLQRYNVATIDVMKKSIERWANQLSTPNQRVEPYFIQLNFKDVSSDAVREKLNAIPTSFNLSDEQVDLLIKTGRDLLYGNMEFKRLLADIRKDDV